MAQIERLDKKLLNQIQDSFPLCPRPFAELGKSLGISEEEALQRVRRLKNEGYIRRLGGVFDSPSLGFYSTLVAAKVRPDHLETVAAYVSGFPGVTHNYQRDHDLNLWFTVTARSEQEVDAVLDKIRSFKGVEILLKLPAEKVYKIGLNLVMK